MRIKVFLLAVGVLVAAGAKAQNANLTDDCKLNISLYRPYAKSGNFKDAYPFWKKVYDECPSAEKALYQYGVNIIKWQISQETDAAKKEELIASLMKLYDDRLMYFGNDPKQGKDYIIARKAQDYNSLKGDATDYGLVYQWTGEVIDEFKDKVDPLAISLYMFASYKQMQNDESKKAQYIADYMKTAPYLDEALKVAQVANNEKDIDALQTRKAEIEQNFATSGAADCETLQSIYAPKVEENKADLEYLKKTINLLAALRCKEIDAYFAASEYAYKLEPTAESAAGLGAKAFRDGDMAAAEKYYTDAIGMTEESDKKADIYLGLAAMALNQRSYGKTKQYCLKALGENPNLGQAYMYLGNVYAASASSTSDDPVLRKCAYYAVVAKFQRARDVDPSVAAEANRQIAKYSQYFPTNEEIFMHPSLEKGKSFSVGGLIGETVTIR